MFKKFLIPLLFLCLFTLPAFAQLGMGVGGGGGNTSGLAPNQNTIYVSPNCGTQTNCYPVKADGKFVKDASWSNGANPVVVTCSNNDCNFTAADTGKSCFGTVSGLLTAPLGTFTYTSAQAGTCSGTATGATAGGGIFVWGTDDTTNLQAIDTAFQAAPFCPSIVFPQGIMPFSQPVFITQPAACGLGFNFAGQFSGSAFIGQGTHATQFVPLPGFNWAGCSTSCMFPNSYGVTLRDFQINGFNQSLSGVAAFNGAFVYLNQNGTIRDVGFEALGASTSQAGFQALNVFGQGDYAIGVQIDNFARSGLICSGANVTIIDSYVNDMPNGSISLTVTSSATCYTYANQWGQGGASGSAVKNSGTWITDSDYALTNDGQVAIRMGAAGAKTYLSRWNYGGTVGGVNTYGIYFGSTGGTVYARDSNIAGGSTNGALNGTAGTFYDEGGNTYTGPLSTFSGNFIADGHSLIATCTGVATASQTLGLYGTGPNEITTACTSTTIGSGEVMNSPRTLQNLFVKAGTGGVNASSGVFTVLKNGGPTTITCTMGTGTFCADSTHIVTVAAGDLISLQFTTQAADTLANVKAQVEWN